MTFAPTFLPLLAQFDPSALGFDGVARLVLDAAHSSNWSLVVAVVLACAVWAARAALAPRIPFLKSDVGAVLLTFAASATGAVVTSLAAGERPSGALLVVALGVAWKAAGGFTTAKKFVLPLLLKHGPRLLAIFRKGA